jgi:hypothetical protein
LRWLLPLGEFGVKFEYLAGKKNVVPVVDALFRLDIDSPKIQEEEAIYNSLRIRKYQNH